MEGGGGGGGMYGTQWDTTDGQMISSPDRGPHDGNTANILIIYIYIYNVLCII